MKHKLSVFTQSTLLFYYVLFLFAFSALNFAIAKEPKNTKQTKSDVIVPYLGPGADKMSPEEYRRIYQEYIQKTILLGYPLIKGVENACDQALQSIFRQVGMFAYPVPKEAQNIERTKKKIASSNVEIYEMAGITIQLLRDAKSGALDRLVLVNSASTKASRSLSQIAKLQIISVEKDKRTGLERIKGLPIGYPHPFLDASSQGLFVRELRFNKSLDNCAPISFTDNSWIGGSSINDTICRETENDVENVWNEKLAPSEFAEKERNRMKEAMKKSAMSYGASAKEAEEIIGRQFREPLSSDINVVGSAMKNLAECHQLAIGQRALDKTQDGSSETEKSNKAGSSKSAE